MRNLHFSCPDLAAAASIRYGDDQERRNRKTARCWRFRRPAMDHRHHPGTGSVAAVAAADYRAGRFEAAALRLRSLRAMGSSTDRPPILTGRLILAMAHWRLRPPPSAAGALFRERGDCEGPRRRPQIPAYGYWHDRLRSSSCAAGGRRRLILDPDFPADPFAPTVVQALSTCPRSCRRSGSPRCPNNSSTALSNDV